MTAQDFDGRLRELSAMVGSDQSMELFNQSYEELLNEVKQEMDADRRQEQAVKMRMMLMHQAGYLMNEHIRYQKMVTPPHMIRGGNA